MRFYKTAFKIYCNGLFLFVVREQKIFSMQNLSSLMAILCLTATSCRKHNENPKSKTDYIPIITANSPTRVTQGEPIQSQVTCGFYEHSAAGRRAVREYGVNKEYKPSSSFPIIY